MKNAIITLQESFFSKERYESKLLSLSGELHTINKYKSLYTETFSKKEIVFMEILAATTLLIEEVKELLQNIRDETYAKVDSPNPNESKREYVINKLNELSIITGNILELIPLYGTKVEIPSCISELLFYNQELIETVENKPKTYSEQIDQAVNFAEVFMSNPEMLYEICKKTLKETTPENNHISTLLIIVSTIKDAASKIIKDHQTYFNSKKWQVKDTNQIPIPVLKSKIKTEPFEIIDEYKDVLYEELKKFVFEHEWRKMKILIYNGKIEGEIIFIGNQNLLPELFKRMRYNKACTGDNNSITYFIVNNWFYKKSGASDPKNYSETSVYDVISKVDKEPTKYYRILKETFKYKLPKDRKDE